MTPADWRPRTTSLIAGTVVATGLIAVITLPWWQALVCLAGMSFGAMIHYGHQVYTECLRDQDL